MRELFIGMPHAADAPADSDGELVLAAAALAGSAGAVHLALTAPHLAESAVLGSLFALAGAGELAWALAILRRPSRAVRAAGAAMLAGVLAAWLMSRTIGLPWGEEPWQAEPAGVLDCMTGAAELAACALAVVPLHARRATLGACLGLTLAVILLVSLVSGVAHAA